MKADTATPTHSPIVSRVEWLAARTAFLREEKEFTRLRDRLSERRRELPRTRLEKNYVFEGPKGQVSLVDLFDGCSQLIIYHFMFGPDWEEGCKGCSFFSDHIDGMMPHLKARDVAYAAVSRSPLVALLPFKKRMGWTFPWVSSFGTEFNRDFGVTLTEEEIAEERKIYNYNTTAFPMDEAPGLSVFQKDDDGGVLHTYSTYGRGLDILINTYNLLDLTPKGRDEDQFEMSMAWLRHHDRYEA